MRGNILVVYVCTVVLCICGMSPAAAEQSRLKPGGVVISGVRSPAGEAYASYYRAVMSGDLDEVRKWVIRDNLNNFDDKKGKMLVYFFQNKMPNEIIFLKEEVKETTALLIAEGHSSSSRFRANINMKFEDNRWKVIKDTWKHQ